MTTVVDNLVCGYCKAPIKVTGYMGRIQRYKGRSWRNESLSVEGFWKWKRFWVSVSCSKHCEASESHMSSRMELTEREFLELVEKYEGADGTLRGG